MRRTTLAIEEGLLKHLKAKAAHEGRTLQEVANELLRQALIRQEKKSDYRLSLRGWEAEERPGVGILDRDKLFDRMGSA